MKMLDAVAWKLACYNFFQHATFVSYNQPRSLPSVHILYDMGITFYFKVFSTCDG